MGLLRLMHKHYPDATKLPTFTDQWIEVSSRRIAVSRTQLLCADFSGCVAVIMSGRRAEGWWGAVSHMHQLIQYEKDPKDDMVKALKFVAEFVSEATQDTIRDVLLYYGDLEVDKRLSVEKVMDAM